MHGFFVAAAALLVCCSSAGAAFDLQAKKGQVVCDTLLEFEELTIAIGMEDDQSIAEMTGKGCHLLEPGARLQLVEAYPDQTRLLFGKLAAYTNIGHVPAGIEKLTNLAKVRLSPPEGAAMVGFTMLRVTPGPDGPYWSSGE